MTRISRRFLVFSIFAAVHAQAAPFLSIGRNAELLLTGSASVRYDDNIFLIGAASEDDIVYTIAPGVEYGYDGGLTQVSLVLNEQFLRYGSNSSLNSNLTTATLDIVSEGSNSRLILRGGYHEFGQNSLNALSPDQTVRRNLTDATVSGEMGMGGRTRVAAGVRYDRTRYPGVGFVGSETVQFPVDIYYSLSAKLDLSVGYRHRDNRMEDGLRDSTDGFLNVGARGQFTPKLTGQVRVGLTKREFDAGGDESQIGTSADLVWFFSPKTTYRLTVANDFSNSPLGISQKELTVSLDGRFAISDQWSTSAVINFSSDDYESGRKDDFVVGDFSVVYRLQENISLQGAYIHRRNNSNIAALDFTNNILSLATSVRY